MIAHNISEAPKTTMRPIDAFYLNYEPAVSFKITKQTLNAPFTPKPAIILNTMYQYILNVKEMATIPSVVIPQANLSVSLLPFASYIYIFIYFFLFNLNIYI